MTILAFIFWVVIALFASGIVTHRKDTQPKNKVHFYVARDKNGELYLWFLKPYRSIERLVNIDHSWIVACSLEFNYYKERDKRYNRLKTYIEKKNKKEYENNERKLYEQLKKKYEKS